MWVSGEGHSRLREQPGAKALGQKCARLRPVAEWRSRRRGQVCLGHSEFGLVWQVRVRGRGAEEGGEGTWVFAGSLRLHMENRLASEDRSREAGRVSRNHDFQVGGGGSGRGEMGGILGTLP